MQDNDCTLHKLFRTLSVSILIFNINGDINIVNINDSLNDEINS